MNYYVDLPAARVGRNALLDLSPVNNALEGVRDQNNANRNALLQQSQLDMRKEEQTYLRGRDQKQDAWQQVQRGGAMADVIQRMPDTDPRKPAAWNKYLQDYGDGNHSPEEMDFRTGPAIAAAAAGKWRDPRDDQMTDLDMSLKRAQIGKLNREAEGGAAKFGKTGAIVQGADGRYYSVQFAEDGTKKIDPLAVGETALTPSRGVSEVDTGTGTQIIDKATGLPVRSVAKDLAGAERAKVVGRETGEGQMALPKTARSLQQYEIKSDNVNKFIDEAIAQAQSAGTTGFVGGMTRAVPGSPAFNLVKKIDPIVANLGFDELQTMRDNSPTGGALGSVAVQELSMLQSTLASLDTAQDGAQLTQHLSRLKEIKAQFRELKRQAYQQDVARFGAAAVPNPQGQPQAGVAQPQTGIAAPQSADEYSRLPSGTRYRDPEGNTRIKP